MFTEMESKIKKGCQVEKAIASLKGTGVVITIKGVVSGRIQSNLPEAILELSTTKEAERNLIDDIRIALSNYLKDLENQFKERNKRKEE